METRNSSFEDHINIVESGHNKVAGSGGNKADGSLLSKIANELGLGQEKVAEGGVTAPGAPTAEGEVSPAASSVAGAAAPVVAATEAVATPQTTIAGGNPQEAAAGEMPAPTKPNEGLAISAGDGKVTDANNLHKTPEAVAAAAEDGGGDAGSAATPSPDKDGAVPDQSLGSEKTAEAVKIGKLIANSFQEELEKKAEDAQYSEAVDILKEAELLDGYEIKDQPMTKEASVEDGYLEKIANKQPLTRQEIIGAAGEFVEFSKEAAFVEEQARQDAREYAEELSKEAFDAEDEGREVANSLVSSVANEINKEAGDNEKIAAALNNEKVVNAVKVLKEEGIL